MYCPLYLLFITGVLADAKGGTPSAQEIATKVLDSRNLIRSGIVSFQVKTTIDAKQPVAEKVVVDYTVYFRGGNIRMDEIRHLASGKIAKYWRVYAFGRCLRSYNEEDHIIVNAAGKRKYNDLGIIHPLLLGLTARRSVCRADKPDIVSPAWPERTSAVVGAEVVDGVNAWRVTSTYDNYRATYWVVPELKFSVIKYAAYVNDTLQTEISCKVSAYANGNLYFPKEVVRRAFEGQGNVIAEDVTSVVEARFDADVPDDVFDMKSLGIPAGRTALNMLGGSKLQVWDGEKLVDRRTDEQKGEPNGGRVSVSYLMIAVCALFVLVALFISRMLRKLNRGSL